MTDLERDSPLFDRILPIQIHGDGLDPDTRSNSIVFRVLQGTQPSTILGQTEKLYHFEVCLSIKCINSELFACVRLWIL
jgi:hypothetical protein